MIDLSSPETTPSRRRYKRSSSDSAAPFEPTASASKRAKRGPQADKENAFRSQIREPGHAPTIPRDEHSITDLTADEPASSINHQDTRRGTHASHPTIQHDASTVPEGGLLTVISHSDLLGVSYLATFYSSAV